MSGVRCRNWLFVFYPDSAPDTWQDVIESWGVSCYVSPLHDSDVNEEGLKKPHWHGVLQFEGNKSYEQVLQLVSQLGCSTAKVCNSLHNSVRYLCHLDSPKKFKYDVSDVTIFGHADLSALYLKNSSELTSDMLDLLKIVRSLQIREFCDLVDYVLDNCCDDYFETLLKNSLFFKNYLVSASFSARS